MRVRTPIGLFEASGIRSPALYGFIRPRILLPTGLVETFLPHELRHVFLHELAHVQRRDIAWNWVLAVLQLLHWFNPFVWLAFARMRADREMACDAMALSVAGIAERTQYGATVIKLLESFRPNTAALPGLIGIFESRNQMKSRIRMIADFKISRAWPLLALGLIACMGVLGLTEAQPRQRQPQSATPPPPADAGSQTEGSAQGSVQNDLLFLVTDSGDSHPLAGALLKVSCCSSQECFLLGRFSTPATGQVSIRYPVNATSLAVQVSKDGYVPKLVTWRPGRNDRIDAPYAAKLRAGHLDWRVRQERGWRARGERGRLPERAGHRRPDCP